MRKIFLAAALLLAQPAWAGVHEVVVIDGDTVTISAGGTTTGFRIRALGMDTPEIHSSCPAERVLARRAKDRLVALAVHGLQVTSDLDTDRYGRILATLRTPNGEEVSVILIREGLARSYDGKSARQPWCAPDGTLLPPGR